MFTVLSRVNLAVKQPGLIKHYAVKVPAIMHNLAQRQPTDKQRPTICDLALPAHA